jgi:RND family efflux transporter MFP subunit
MRARIIIPIVLLLFGLAGAWVWRGLPPAVAVASATLGPAVQAVYATGNVEPVHWARVGPAVRARITAVLVEEGARVEAGQPMAQLDDREARHRVEEAEARANFAQEDLTRVRALVARDVASRAALDRAEAEARAVRAVAEAAQRRMDDYIVRAPSAGLVLRRDAEVGEVVDTPAALFWIGEPKPLRITAEVDEEDIAQIREGQRALLRADAFAGQVLNATVTQVTPKGDATRKAYRVRLSLPDDTPLMIGMTVEANIVLREATNAVLIPPAALRGDQVFIVQGEVARRRQVAVGVQGPRAVEIRQGIAAGDIVVLDPPQGLKDGQALRLRP